MYIGTCKASSISVITVTTAHPQTNEIVCFFFFAGLPYYGLRDFSPFEQAVPPRPVVMRVRIQHRLNEQRDDSLQKGGKAKFDVLLVCNC